LGRRRRRFRALGQAGRYNRLVHAGGVAFIGLTSGKKAHGSRWSGAWRKVSKEAQ
jgi:hypothetical protein